ncbi:hypothetical protein ACTFIV_005904 [Dictyostelium citrinum]
MFKKFDKLKEKVSGGISNLSGKDTNEPTYIIQPADVAQLVGGFVIGFGLNAENQLSQPSPKSEYKNLVSIPSSFKHNIANVSLGNSHCFYHTKDGKFYYAGTNRVGEFGTVSTGHVDELTQFNHSTLKFKEIICAQQHTMFIGVDGKLYGSGKPELLGMSTDEAKKTPTLIPALSQHKIALYATSNKHSFAVTEDGILFGWGKSDLLGIGSFVKVKKITVTTKEPIVIDTCSAFLSFRIKSIACGEEHTIALLETGDVYGWGRGDEGQLGHGIKENRVSPILIDSVKSLNVISVQCGAFNSSALTTDKECYIWGQFGEELIMTPQPLCPGGSRQPLKVQQISQNGFYNIVVTLSGDIYHFGIDYKLFTKSAWIPTLLKIDDPLLMGKRVTQVAASAAGYYMIIYDGTPIYYPEIDHSRKGAKPTKTLAPLPESQYSKNKDALFGGNKPTNTTYLNKERNKNNPTTTTTTTSSSNNSRNHRDNDEDVL